MEGLQALRREHGVELGALQAEVHRLNEVRQGVGDMCGGGGGVGGCGGTGLPPFCFTPG